MKADSGEVGLAMSVVFLGEAFRFGAVLFEWFEAADTDPILSTATEAA